MKKFISCMIAVITIVSMLSVTAFAEEGTSEKSVRTVMLYACGADLETDGGMATFNLMQILRSNFSKDGSVRFIIMTGGSNKWKIDGKYLCEADGTPIEEVSNEYNQLWEAKGLDAPESEHPGKMTLLDGDGITGGEGEAVPSKDELMSEPETLKAFINYCHDNYPAEKYDLILWDHGGGPSGGFGIDEHSDSGKTMPFDGLIDAFSDNEVTKEGAKFDFIDFDACLMNSVELSLAFAKYTDYYIASPETEPGYGQDYEGWLNMAGKDPDCDTYELGKKIVDDFYEFYENGHGKAQEGTLAVINTKKFLRSDMITAVNVLSEILAEQLTEFDDALGLYAFYDELYASRTALTYGNNPNFVDIGDLAALLGANAYETTLDDVDGGIDNIRNTYANTSEWFDEILSDTRMMYARGTSGIKTDPQMVRRKSGLIFEEAGTSGLYIYFPTPEGKYELENYMKFVKKALEKMDKNDRSAACLRRYLQVVIKYVLLQEAGQAVGELIEPSKDTIKMGIKKLPRDEVNYEKVVEYWKASLEGLEEWSEWNLTIKDLYTDLNGGEEAAKAWLEPLIRQQAEEAVDASKISVDELLTKEGTVSQVTINDTGRRVIDRVSQDVVAELPALEDYKESLPEDDPDKSYIENARLALGTVDAVVNFDVDWRKTGDELIEDIIRWNLGNVSKWNIHPIEQKWYAVKPVKGDNLVVSIFAQDSEIVLIPTLSDDKKFVLFMFSKKDGSLLAMGVKQPESDGIRDIDPAQLTGEMKVKPIIYYNLLGVVEKFFPISGSDFTVSKDNYKDIKLIYTDIADIPDIGDTTGDENPFSASTIVTDIYGKELDITDKVNNPTKTLIGIDRAEISSGATYSKDHEGGYLPTFTLDGKTLEEGKDYKYLLKEDMVKPGEYYLSIEGIGEYGGSAFHQFVIEKGNNPLKVKAKTFSIKGSQLKKKDKTVKVSKVIRTLEKGAGKVTYKKTSGNKKITISKKTGKVTIKKGLKKGTYKVKVKVQAAGDSIYAKSKAKTVNVTVKVI